MSQIPRHIELGIQFGHINEDWTLRDYFLWTVDHEDSFETGIVHGSQGSGKSTRALQYGGWIKLYELTKKLGRPPTEEELWTAVLDTLVFSPADFVKKLEAVPMGERLSLVIWDDIQLNYTSSTFRTDVAQYQAIDSTFAVIRKKLGICVITIPNITRLPKNIKDNVSLEIYVGRNRLEQIRRIYRLPGTRNIDSNLFKPILERPSHFDLYSVPRWAWEIYDRARESMADKALANLRGATDMEDMENYTPVVDLGIKLGLSPNTLQQMVSRGVVLGKKVNGLLCIHNDWVEKILQIYGDKEASKYNAR